MAPFNPAVYYNNNPLPDIDIEMVVKIKHSARGLADAPQIDVNGLEIKVRQDPPTFGRCRQEFGRCRQEFVRCRQVFRRYAR
jgi:hypothetical protein